VRDYYCGHGEAQDAVVQAVFQPHGPASAAATASFACERCVQLRLPGSTYTFADSAEIPSALRPLALTNAATPLSATLLTAFFGIDSVPSVVG